MSGIISVSVNGSNDVLMLLLEDESMDFYGEGSLFIDSWIFLNVYYLWYYWDSLGFNDL